MDRYFHEEITPLSIDKLHTTGVISMLVASKMDELIPFRMRTIFNKIVHEKISISELKEAEGKFLNTLCFKLITDTFYDRVLLYLNNYFVEAGMIFIIV